MTIDLQTLIATVDNISDLWVKLSADPIANALANEDLTEGDLVVDNFLQKRDNPHRFKGLYESFLTCKPFEFVGTLPDLIPEPEMPRLPRKDDYTTAKELTAARIAYAEAMENYEPLIAQWETDYKPLNDRIVGLQAKIAAMPDLVQVNARLAKVQQFLAKHDPIEFVSYEPLKPHELPQTIKSTVVKMIQDAFAANPTITLKGDVQIEIPDTPVDFCDAKGEVVGSAVPNCSDAKGIKALVAFKKGYPYSKFSFYDKALYLRIMQTVDLQLNCWETKHNLASLLDVDFGGSVNTATILEGVARHLM